MRLLRKAMSLLRKVMKLLHRVLRMLRKIIKGSASGDERLLRKVKERLLRKVIKLLSEVISLLRKVSRLLGKQVSERSQIGSLFVATCRMKLPNSYCSPCRILRCDLYRSCCTWGGLGGIC